MKPYLDNLYRNKLLKGKGFALDIGCYKGEDALTLARLGYTVDALDIDISHALYHLEDINYIEADIISADIDKSKYSLIVANNSLPFISDKESVKNVLRRMKDGLKKGGIMHFSIFGPESYWFGRRDMSFFEYYEITDFVKTLGLQIYEKSSIQGFRETMSDGIRFLDVHRFTLINQKAKDRLSRP